MSSPWKKQPEDVVDSVLKRAQVSKIARRLQNRLALAQFKTKHGFLVKCIRPALSNKDSNELAPQGAAFL
ncbi:hypothetical protein CDD83_4940 [Cordyceps sp. RAO-2017]|nr:hypothetical protein CDD83_4940 [Cordyceps sp. RAO-2017]